MGKGRAKRVEKKVSLNEFYFVDIQVFGVNFKRVLEVSQ